MVLAGWRDRPGPRYHKLSAAILDAVDGRIVGGGSRLPAERLLAAALGVSRGTVVACYDELAQAQVVRRRQGSGTFVVGRPGWAREPAENPAAALLFRRLAGGRGDVDLSLSVPAGVDHLPPWDAAAVVDGFAGHGLDPAGAPVLRERIAEHLTRHQDLPTVADQLVVTAGAQQALSLLAATVGPRPKVVTACPTYPGLISAFAGRRARVVGVAGDSAGVDPDAFARACQRASHGVAYVAPNGHNPTGAVLARPRRAAVVEAATAAGFLVVEDLALTDLVLDEPPPAPLSAGDERVVAVGTVSKLLWAGLRIGWVRAPEPLRTTLIRAKAAADLAASVPAQLLTAELLSGVDAGWLGGLRAALRVRRDVLAELVAGRLPSWEVPRRPAAGLSLWVELPVADTSGFAHVAARHGVTVAPGAAMCPDGRHRGGLRLSFAEPIDVLDLATDRLAAAWEAHSEDLAATPMPGGR